MAPKWAQCDELRTMGYTTPVGVILKKGIINYKCSQLGYGETCNFLVCSRTKLTHHSFMTQLLLSKLLSGNTTVSHIFPYFSLIT